MFYIGLYRKNIKKSSCLKPQGLESWYNWYVASPSGPLPSWFKLCPWGKKWPAPGSHPKYSQISVIRTSIIRNYWVIRRRRTVPIFFSIIYCNKTTNYSNFDYPKKSIFRSDSSVPINEIAIKLPFKIRSPNVTHGDHDFFLWSSSIYTPEWFSKQSWDR